MRVRFSPSPQLLTFKHSYVILLLNTGDPPFRVKYKKMHPAIVFLIVVASISYLLAGYYFIRCNSIADMLATIIVYTMGGKERKASSVKKVFSNFFLLFFWPIKFISIFI